MFKNYLKVAIRNIYRHKGYAFINIAGLAIGMACCILIFIYIMTELSYDKFHENADRIYRLSLDASLGERIIYMPVSNNPTALVLVKDYPEVESATRIRTRSRMSITYQSEQYYQDGIMWADNSLFDVFTFPMLRGDPKTALETAYSLVLTESTAKKYFGNEDPLGKVLKFNNQADYTVTGVIENIPHNSHFSFNMLTSFETMYANNPKEMAIWLNFNNYTYLRLQENYDPALLEQKFPALIDQYMGATLKALGGTMKFFLQPLTSIHLHSHMENELQGNGNILYVYIFSAIALFILAIACINFMNLATARSAKRAREVSMRKVVGATKSKLITQFLGETVFLSIISLVLALLLVWLALPYFSSISGIELRLTPAEMGWLIPTIFALILLVGLAAGSYPALFLAAFQPAQVLKGSLKAGAANSRFRSVLVVTQFIISIALIIGTSIILNQLKYMKQKELGFNKENVVVTRIRNREAYQAMDSIKTQLKQIPGVESVSSSDTIPGGQPNISIFIPEGFSEDQSQIMAQFDADHDFCRTLGIEVIEGRNFSPEFGTDRDEAILINETAKKKFGWDNPVGKTIKVPASQAADGSLIFREKKVVGVIQDFHQFSLHQTIMPMIIENGLGSALSIRINPENTSTVLNLIKQKWTAIDPLRPFDYFFLEDDFDSQYQAEERLSNIFASFTIFAIFIACLGLFGMASFTAEQRTKEIGIRKVLGASISGVVAMLSKDFLKLIVIANLIAWPIAYYGMQKWLQDFAYRTTIGIWIFVLTGVLAVGIALLTVSYQSLRAAMSDPVKAIKYE